MTGEFSTHLARYAGAQSNGFGDSARLPAQLPALVRAGKKSATCPLLAEVAGGELLPQIGCCDIALTFDRRPALVNRTMELRVVQVDTNAELIRERFEVVEDVGATETCA